jgi:hypothetical protein
MSYILDALRKRQVENDPDAAMTLALMQAQHAEAAQPRQTRALWAIGTALLINAALLGWWLLRPDPRAADVRPATTQVPSLDSARQPSQASGVDSPVTAERPIARENPPSRDLATRPPPARPAAGPAPEQAVAARPSPPRGVLRSVTLGELSRPERDALGPLEFSSHVFGDLSWVVLNGNRLQPGDRLGAIRLHTITEDGVEIEFRDYLVAISVVDLWDD